MVSEGSYPGRKAAVA